MTALTIDRWAAASIGFIALFLILALNVIPGVMHALVRRPDEHDDDTTDPATDDTPAPDPGAHP